MSNCTWPLLQAARMQQAKQAAAANWRATLSGGGAQMKENVDKPREQRERPSSEENQAQLDDKKTVEQVVSGLDVQSRAQWDRYMYDYRYSLIYCHHCAF